MKIFILQLNTNIKIATFFMSATFSIFLTLKLFSQQKTFLKTFFISNFFIKNKQCYTY